MVDEPGYSLSLSEAEIDRYRFMAQVARQQESERWASAGLVEGARVGDIGCGPGLVTVELADVVGPRGSVIGVEVVPALVEFGRQNLAALALPWARIEPALVGRLQIGQPVTMGFPSDKLNVFDARTGRRM